MVEQFGLAIILSSAVSTSPFTSGTTNFFVGSIRHAEELSITVMPASANNGAYSVEVPPPAENNATLGFRVIASGGVITLYFFHVSSFYLPLLFSDASGFNSVTGKLRSDNIFNISVSTIPVASTTATYNFLHVYFNNLIN